MSDFKKPFDNQAAIKKGQAYNLAIMTAGFQGKLDDNEFIIKSFLRHMQFSALLQKATNEQLVAALGSDEMMELIAKMDDVCSKK